MGTSEQQPKINEKLIFGRKKIHISAAKAATGLRFRIGILPSAVFSKKKTICIGLWVFSQNSIIFWGRFLGFFFCQGSVLGSARLPGPFWGFGKFYLAKIIHFPTGIMSGDALEPELWTIFFRLDEICCPLFFWKCFFWIFEWIITF